MDFNEIKLKLKKWFPTIMKYLFFIVSLETIVLVILRCPYVIPFLACDMCPVVDCPSKYYRKPFVAFIVGYMIIFRADFCSKICPYGSLNDILYKIRRKISKKPFKLSLETKTILNFLKYLFFICAIIAIIYGNPRYYVPLHTSDLITSLKLAYLAAGNAYFARLYVIVGALLLGLLLIPRFWCRYICPLGTGIQLTKKGIRKIRKIKTVNGVKSCGDCSKCGKNDN